MKKYLNIIIVAIFCVTMFSFSSRAQACSPVPPTGGMGDYAGAPIQQVRDEGASVFVVRTLSSGNTVVGERVSLYEGDPETHVVLRAISAPCGSGAIPFEANKYVLVIAPDEDDFIIQSGRSGKFLYFYSTLVLAEQNAERVMNGENPVTESTYVQSLYTPAGYTLRPGMKNNDVARLQETFDRILPRLAVGQYIPFVIDGSYGPKTTNAVEQVQNHLGIPVDGIAGMVTQQKIHEALQPSFNADE